MKSPTILLVLIIVTCGYSLPRTIESQSSDQGTFEFVAPGLKETNIQREAVMDVANQSINKTISEANGPLPRFSFVGQYGGKYYYRDVTERTWADSKAFCQNQGMELAALTSSELWNFIYYSIPSGYWYWTASKDSGLASQFRYFLRNSNVAQNYLHNSNLHSESCISVYGSSLNTWYVYSCNDYLGGVLCQV